MLKLKNLSVSIENKKILKDIDFEFKKGKIYAVMGPNGSGKSTLAYAIMGHPAYKLVTRNSQLITQISFKNEDITDLEANERAEKGIFLSFQSPLALSGVTVYQLLQLAMNGKKDPLTIRREAQKYAKELGISEELLNRPLNEGASGGERKKMEVLQAAVLDKKFLIFDEVDTGVDVDALKKIAGFLKKHQENRTYVLITHYNRILHHLQPDYVLIMMDGKIVKVGDASLAKKIEEKGYSAY
ncbi:Fe-S cluster assembly ATPase SufC [Candidatus Roizmanbacteria bacterium RIFCSPLOWO2_01_FULL_38_12]|uniref:Fe-S cluster assembly ATPase SufC n=1 Tax=Candidatus Roizmanbacteria bacterium RIFCSPLOWO2_01_FULL_38_12 TaxID=1802061 RepID=A0A1F7IWE2_9BACT|nr:MAG: Fe-S cluster assembly ATPase SufC [Candidatus Roizmanbacteria bacterium RIFCSPHIGHO2_01_FULL_38_15]OGK35596.1 MAG: Fe-S cluster assembly ATPase SufC [Candidatus Roizmanbacteria bacterium RIFCSPHIGHO2_12_FULL_38_13]OGK47671.1 MAG: Fe-S cluster assembly ATPase SufC [Candidatus Roizmanbacteria bacterium RIFCSPLOWO2_01_FULL_38_12]